MISTPFVAVPPRDYGGTELVIHELVEGLVAAGHDVTLFATGDSLTSAELRAFYPEAKWPPEPFIDLNHISWAMHQAAAEPFDVVHVHAACALAIARMTPDLPVVYTLHHARDPRLSAFYEHFPEVQFVAISADQRRRAPEIAHCRVIHHGLDGSRYGATDRPDDYVCFVGRFAREKGLHNAIDAAAAAGVPIRVAGSVHPPDRPYAESCLTERLAAPGVTLLGPVGMTAKTGLLREARALLAPIEWDEPFGLIMVEAMLSGCPVVAFPRGSVPELVEPGITGFVVDSIDAMADAIAPGGAVDRIDRLRCRARAVRRFSRARLVEEYERCYAQVAAGSDRTPNRPGRRPSTAA
ncbi:MAG TPA: glycosyltransferase family 4 protein [Gemmatimonadales bacterium]|nr:glycosyltransferase family 4 protein [Gemmatimonadales bacterium]